MKQKTFAALLFSIALITLPLTPMAQTGPQPQTGPKDGTGLSPADLNRIKVGEAAPDFALEDQDGKLVSLSDYRGNKTVVLVFYRGYW